MDLRSPIFNMFGRSPIRPLEEHINKATACAALLVPFSAACLRQDWPQAQTLFIEIGQLEREADSLKKDLRLHLPKGLFLPVARSDVLELLAMQDRIANKAEDIAGLMLGRKMQLPAPIADAFMPFLQRSIDATTQACRAINELDELLETGFRGNEVTLVEQMIHQLDEIEHDSDEQQVAIREKIFEIEEKMAPIDAIFLYKVIELVGDLADCAQTVGGRLEILLAR